MKDSINLFQGLNPYQRVNRRRVVVLFGTLFVFWAILWLAHLLPGDLIPAPNVPAFAGMPHTLGLRISLWIDYFDLDSGPPDEYFADYFGIGFLAIYSAQIANLFVSIDSRIRRLPDDMRAIPGGEAAVVRSVIALNDARWIVVSPVVYCLCLFLSPLSVGPADGSGVLMFVGFMALPVHLVAILIHGDALMKFANMGRVVSCWWILPMLGAGALPVFDATGALVLVFMVLDVVAGFYLLVAIAADFVGLAEFPGWQKQAHWVRDHTIRIWDAGWQRMGL